ncbi:hypothetical protein D3C71_2083140 [compost metagenome]
MSGPDADAAGKTTDGGPKTALTAFASLGTQQQQHGCDATGQANHGRHQHQTPIVIIAYACNH